MQNTIFFVNSEPYCLWELDIPARNAEFIQGIDPGYFEYLLDTHIDAEDDARSAIALRAALYHALETFFSLLGAYIQAPDCAYAWILKCRASDLRRLADSINPYRSDVRTKLNIERVTWRTVAESIFYGYLPGTEKSSRTVELFAVLWGRLAREFLDPAHRDEYNSIKHGFRIRSGGFILIAGVEREYGVAPPESEMQTIGGSSHGSSYFKLEPIGPPNVSRSVRSRRHSLNWRIERTILQLQLVSMSIQNISSALKIANGIDASECRFDRPEKDEDFERPWTYSTGVTSSSLDTVIAEDDSMITSREQLISLVDGES